MTRINQQRHPTDNGYLTEKIRSQYIANAVAGDLLPENAHRMAALVSLDASDNPAEPIQFWQLYSVLGQDRIVNIVRSFYQRVFHDENWFQSVFARVGGINHHVNTQSAMWIDVMGGGPAYHGGEYRLSFHHTHNAMQLMNDKGAKRWVKLMVETLDDRSIDMTDDSRVRPAINTFLSHFFAKYADEFNFSNTAVFGETNGAVKRKINLMKLTDDEISSLSVTDLKQALSTRGIDVDLYPDKAALVSKALRL